MAICTCSVTTWRLLPRPKNWEVAQSPLWKTPAAPLSWSWTWTRQTPLTRTVSSSMATWTSSPSARVGLRTPATQWSRTGRCGAEAQWTTATLSSRLCLPSRRVRRTASVTPDAWLRLKAVRRERCKIQMIVIGYSDDLLYYIKSYKHLMGSPNMVVCLDSGASTPD